MKQTFSAIRFFALALAIFVTATDSRAQDTFNGPDSKHWPLQKISFPVDTERLSSLNPKPVKLRFYAAPPGGKFELISERRIDELEDIIDQGSRITRKGFNYTSRADGAEEFALQYVFQNNDVSPLSSKLVPQYRIVFDTRAPAVRMNATAATSIEWVVEDENLIADSIKLEVKYPEQSKWTPVGVRAFGTRDKYTWTNIPPGKVLEVRVTAKDRAGHEGVSQVVQLPATNGGNRFPRPGDPGTNNDPNGIQPKGGPGVGSSFGNPEDSLNRPQIEYVNTNKLTVRTKFTRVTRSGIIAAVLWVNDGKSGWKEDKKKEGLQITTMTKDPQVEIAYDAPKDGLYGFLVSPINGAGGKPDDPRETDPAQWLVEVDTVIPQVEVRAVRVSPGGLTGPRVEIEWAVVEKNLMPEPITIEYQEIEGKNLEWKPIAIKIPNTGRYIWEVEDKNLWKFKVRVMAVDKASNSGRGEYKDPVLVDLEKPAAVIEKVQGSGPTTRNFRPDGQPAPGGGGIAPQGGLMPVPSVLPITNKTPEPEPLPKKPEAPAPIPKAIEVPVKIAEPATGSGPAVPSLPAPMPAAPMLPSLPMVPDLGEKPK